MKEDTNNETSNLSKLSELVSKLEQANKKAEENIKKQEEIIALKLLGGMTDAVPTQTQQKQETPKEYAKRVSTGML